MGSAKYYTVSQLARAAEVPTTTVRYYERIGLLHPAGRTTGNYRFYDDKALGRLRFIRAAQRAGFTLEDVSLLLSIQEEGASACHDVQGIIMRRLAEIESRVQELRQVRQVLKNTLTKCRQSERQGRCYVVSMLRRTT